MAVATRPGSARPHPLTFRAGTVMSLLQGRGIGGLAASVAIVWGLCFVLIQSSLPSPAPLLLAAFRALLGGIVLALAVAVRNSRRRDPIAALNPGPVGLGGARLPTAPQLVALALANVAIAFGAMYLAAGRAEAAVASILAGGQPLILVAAGWLLFRERASVRSVTGLAVAMMGVVLVSTASSGATSTDGIVLALAAAAAPAAGTVLMRRLAPTVDLLATTSAQFLLGGAILLVASAVLEPWGAVSWSAAMLPALLVLGVLGTGVAYVVWFWLLDRVPLARLGMALFLVPVAGVLAGVVTGDRPGLWELAGIAAVLAGVAIVSVGGPARSAEGPALQTA